MIGWQPIETHRTFVWFTFISSLSLLRCRNQHSFEVRRPREGIGRLKIVDLDLKVVLRLFFSKQNNYHMKSQHTFYLYIIALISLKKNCVKHSSCYLHSMSIKFEFRGRSSIWYGPCCVCAKKTEMYLVFLSYILKQLLSLTCVQVEINWTTFLIKCWMFCVKRYLQN